MGDRFTEIYENAEWGGNQPSGPGSDPHQLDRYRELVQQLIDSPEVGRVVDLGCGDWSLAQAMDWSTVEYLGLDVVPAMIQKHQAEHGCGNIQFELAGPPGTPPPEADLLIVKDVLQHWSNAQVRALLDALPTVRLALITNDRDFTRRSWRTLWRRQRLCDANCDTATGGYRPLDLRSPPFSLEAEKVLEFKTVDGADVFTKETLLWTRDDGSGPKRRTH